MYNNDQKYVMLVNINEFSFHSLNTSSNHQFTCKRRHELKTKSNRNNIFILYYYLPTI